MQLLDHVSITVRDLAKVKAFYIAVMRALQAEIAYEEAQAIGFGERNSGNDASHSYISVFESPQAHSDPRRHVCFRALSVAQVDAFYAAGIAHDGGCAGAPGLRDYHPHYYAAFLFDPDGNKIEAVFHHADRTAG